MSETICSIRTKCWWNSHWMVLFQKYVRWVGPSTKMAPTAELSLTRTLWEIYIKIFSSETTGPIATKLWWNGPWMTPFQHCVRWSWLPTRMATKLKIEKREDAIKKNSSPLKLLSQSQPNLAEMILGWSPSKIVSGISDLRPRWPPQPNLI